MRIALVHDFDEGRLFGVRYYVERLREALGSRVELLDVVPRPSGTTRRGVASTAMTLFVKELVYPLEIRLWKRLVDADLFHVVDQSHAHLVSALPDPRVVTCHDLFNLEGPDPFRRFGFRRRLRGLRRANAIIAVSRDTARRLESRCGIDRSRIRIVPNGVPRFFLEPVSDAATDAALGRVAVPAPPFLLHVGNNLPYKNLERILAAIGRLDEPPPLVKVGARLTSRQRRRAQVASVHVVELGEVPAEILRALYRRAAALVYPSLHEGFGWPVAEALAVGTPVVTSTRGALSEVTGGAALEVDPEDVGSIAVALGRVLAEPQLCRDLAVRGRGRAEELAAVPVGDTLLAVYRELVEEGR